MSFEKTAKDLWKIVSSDPGVMGGVGQIVAALAGLLISALIDSPPNKKK